MGKIPRYEPQLLLSSPRRHPVMYFSYKAEKLEELMRKTTLFQLWLSVVMRKRVAEVTPTLQTARWASCLAVD